MDSTREEEFSRLINYAKTYDLDLLGELGFGNQGSVVFTSQDSALKVFRREEHYRRERDVYVRLMERDVRLIRGCAVPRLVNYNNHLWIVEMSVVEPPCVLDFASAYLDNRPDYSAEVFEERAVENAELFGDDWPEVELVIAAFERYGIFLVDVHPGNIRLHP